MLVVRRIASIVGTVTLSVWSGIALALNLIGYATLPEDAVVAQGYAHRFLLGVAELPGWLPYTAALIAILWLTWVSWPRQIVSAERTTAPPPDVVKTQAQALSEVARDLDRTVAPLRQIKRAIDRRGGRLDADHIHRHAMAFRGALRSLETLGFTVPWIDYEADPMGYILVSVKFVDRVVPLLSRGHTADAQAESERETADSKKFMAARANL